MGEHLYGIWVVFVSWLWFQSTDTFAKIVVYVLAVGDACNIELDIVYALKALILWPDADMVAFVLDAEVLEFMDGCIGITAANYYLHLRCANRVAILVEEIEMAWLIGCWRLFRRCMF